MIDLLPCPFCGGKALYNTRHDEYLDPYREQYIQCTKCRIKSPSESRHPDDGKSAKLIKTWNTRNNGWIEKLKQIDDELTKGFDSRDMSYDLQTVNWVHKEIANMIGDV